MGAHALLQPRAERNARLLLALWMEEGVTELLSYPVSELPTEPIQELAQVIQSSLDRGRKGFAEIADDNTNRMQELAGVAGELSEIIARGDSLNIHTLKKELREFHQRKTEQILSWKLQAKLDRGEDVSEIIAQLSKLQAANFSGADKIRALLKERAFDHNHSPEKPIPLFSLSELPICTAGNISNIQAPAKAGKSAVLESMIASAFKPIGQASDTLSFKSENVHGKALIHFDTEQSRYDADSLIRRAMRRVNIEEPPAWFKSYSMADLSIEERKDCLRYSMEQAVEESGGIFAVMIDGVGDLSNDPNDSLESFGLVAELHTLAIKYDCSIITVLHENPGSENGKTRGHLGSQLERKAETNLRLSKDKDGITTIWSERARHGHLPKQQGRCFAWNAEYKMHRSCGSASEIKQAAKLDKMEAEAIKAFGHKDGLTYTELVDAIHKHLNFCKSTANSRIRTWLREGIISKDVIGKHSLKD